MNKNIILQSLILCILVSVTSVKAGNLELNWIENVGAKDTPDKTEIYNVSDYGAIGDAIFINTTAIQAAIDDCFSKGGGIVTFSSGKYLTGSIYLKEGVHLIIPEGVMILGSTNINDYPDIDTRIAGTEMVWPSALINVLNEKNVMISGKGIINGQGKIFWDTYWTMRKEYEKKGLRWVVDQDCKRPRSLLVSESSDVTVKDLTFQQAGFWTIQLLYSSYCTIEGVTIQNNIGGSGPSTDGIDIDSSDNILVENCDVDCNDDTYCLKAGRDADGLRVNKPTEYIVIRNCISRKGAAMITCGSETSGSIRYILAEGMKAKGTSRGFLLKSAMTRGGTVEYVYIRNSEMDKVGITFEANVNWNPSYSYPTLPKEYENQELPEHWYKLLEKVEPAERGIPYFRNLYLSDITITNSTTFLNVHGVHNSIVENVTLKNIDINVDKAGSVSYAKNWTVENIGLNTKDNKPVKITNCENVDFPYNPPSINPDALYETDFYTIPYIFPHGDFWGKGTSEDAGKEKSVNAITFGAGPYGQRINFNNEHEANAFGSNAGKYISETKADDGATPGAFSFVKSDGGNGGGYMILPSLQGPFKLSVWNASGNEYPQKYDIYFNDKFKTSILIPGGKYIKKNIIEYNESEDVSIKFLMSDEIQAEKQNLYFYNLLIESIGSPHGIANTPSDNQKQLIQQTYYNLTGKPIYYKSAKGIFIEKSVYQDGTISYKKIYKKESET